MKKRIFAIMLAVCVMVTSVPMTARAEETADQNRIPVERSGSLERGRKRKMPEELSDQIETVQPGQMRSRSIYGSAIYNTEWDKYSSNYVYNRLSSDEKSFWDALDYIGRSYLLGSGDARLQADEDGYYGVSTMKAPYENISPGWAWNLFEMFIYANPQYYFLDGGCFLSSVNLTPTIYQKFVNGTTRSAETAKLKRQVDAWEAEIGRESTEVLKAKKAHDLIIDRVFYDHNYTTAELADNPFHQSAYSVFCDDHTVCAGYTKAYEMLMNGAGVDTMAVTYYNEKAREGHAWNIIKVNNLWYHTDLTWDDRDDQGATIYDYFNRSGTFMTSLIYHSPESCYFGLLPSSTQDSKGNQTYHIPTIKAAVPSISLKAVSGGVQVTLKSATSGADIYYTLDGRDPSDNTSRSYQYQGSFVTSKSVTVKAIAVRDTYLDSNVSSKSTGKSCKITFKSNGGSSVSTKYILSNGKITKPKDPKKKNKGFGGWYSDSGFKKAWNFNTKVTGNVTLYAKWLDQYTIKFDANRGSVSKKSQKATSTLKYGTLPSPKRKGYTFSGWYTKKSGGTKITSTSKVKIKKTTTFYAHWKKINLGKGTISKLQNQSGKKLKVTVKKVSGADGYRIRYSLKSNMKSAKYVSMKGTTQKTVTGLKKGKKYYVQVQAYKIDSTGNKKYGSWSSVKQKKISK